MPTQAQIDAARRNGAKSKGPKTAAGKAISSANSLRHGLTAKAILLTNENPEAYTQLADAYYEKFQPADDVERDLVDEMVIAKWRQRRDWSNEAALFDLEMDRQTKKIDAQYQKIDHACRYALAFRALADESKSIQLLTRYETAHRRSYYKALATLLQLRAELNPAPEPDQPPQQDPSENMDEPSENNKCETNPTNDERTTTNEQPATSNHEPATSNQQRATSNDQRRLSAGRTRWKAGPQPERLPHVGRHGCYEVTLLPWPYIPHRNSRCLSAPGNWNSDGHIWGVTKSMLYRPK